MNTETLERLMLDRGLGALPPDCEALLAAYLEERPEAAAACRRFERTVGLARAALAEKPAGPPPAFPTERLLQTRWSYRGWRIMRNAAGIAAAILIGFGAHGLLFRAEPPSPIRPGPTVIAQAGSDRRSEANDGGSSFWSSRRLYERASETLPKSSNRVIWDSPVKPPHIGDAT